MREREREREREKERERIIKVTETRHCVCFFMNIDKLDWLLNFIMYINEIMKWYMYITHITYANIKTTLSSCIHRPCHPNDVQFFLPLDT